MLLLLLLLLPLYAHIKYTIQTHCLSKWWLIFFLLFSSLQNQCDKNILSQYICVKIIDFKHQMYLMFEIRSLNWTFVLAHEYYTQIRYIFLKFLRIFCFYYTKKCRHKVENFGKLFIVLSLFLCVFKSQMIRLIRNLLH